MAASAVTAVRLLCEYSVGPPGKSVSYLKPLMQNFLALFQQQMKFKFVCGPTILAESVEPAAHHLVISPHTFLKKKEVDSKPSKK